jgi:hypothetical protein
MPAYVTVHPFGYPTYSECQAAIRSVFAPLTVIGKVDELKAAPDPSVAEWFSATNPAATTGAEARVVAPAEPE